MDRNLLSEHIAATYHDTPEHPFSRVPSYIAFRHKENRKIYCLVMDVPREKVGLSGNDYVDILEMKCTEDMKMFLTGQRGILPAYHMKSGNWITVILDGSVPEKQLFSLLDLSYELTSGKTKNGKPHNPYWIAPANPKIYDVDQAICEGNGVFIWKQARGAIVGDTVYLYVAAPISAIRYECEVLETDIPYNFSDEKVTMMKVMTLKVVHEYQKDEFPLDVLRQFGVTTVRGPRSVPAALLDELRAAK